MYARMGLAILLLLAEGATRVVAAAPEAVVTPLTNRPKVPGVLRLHLRARLGVLRRTRRCAWRDR